MASLSLLNDGMAHVRLSLSKSRKKNTRPYADEDDDDSDNIGSNNDEDDSSTDAHLLYAQKLNNNAAMCIGIGYHERAIQSLQEALKFSQKQSDESLTKVCRCDGCKMDGGIDFSTDFESNETTSYSYNKSIPSRGTKGYKDEESSDEEDDHVRKISRSMTRDISLPRLQKISCNNTSNSCGEGKKASWSIKDEYCDEELYEPKDEEIYKRPIRVTQEGHPIGSSLFLIIAFNLALTHHLEFATTYNHKSCNPKSAKKTLLFYELTSTYEKRILADTKNCWDSLCSIRFNTILNNNLNQILSMLPAKRLPATHRLLSGISDAIDNETERFNRRKSKVSASKKIRKSNGAFSGKGGNSSRHSRPKKSPARSGRSKSQQAQTTKRSSSRRSLKKSRGRSRSGN
mmetsp:Transcript_7926/g.17034  ORF Transcript_7926/g.17034 Transcript_7926/m.17034 type:complete len:401 (+) Transcript_7926:70-1272(+)